MSWKVYHTRSETLAAEAEIANRRGEMDLARSLYAEAAESETLGLELLDPAKQRTLGISAVSAVALWFKAQKYEMAEQMACSWLSKRILPDFASEQLKILLQEVWSEFARTHAGVQFIPGQVTVSIKGGEVVTGGAPLDLVLQTVQTVQAIFFRTAEYLKDIPLRRRGSPNPEIQEMCRPWLFQAAPGSYQFAVAIQDSHQPDLFSKKDGPQAKEVAKEFLAILRASVDDPVLALSEVVKDEDYRSTFLKLTRNLAPDGKSFSQIEIRSPEQPHPITLTQTERNGISKALNKKPRKEKEVNFPKEILTGILRALHLDKDWLELAIGDNLVKVSKVGAMVDDVIGPMVNRKVIVNAMRDPNGQYLFLDIELVY